MPFARSISSAALAFLALGLTACSTLSKGPQPRETFDKARWTHAPTWATGSIRQEWWKDYGSDALNRDIATALAHNPSLTALAARLEQASAVVETARSASYPKINLGFGMREGRSREVDFGPYGLQPFTASSNLSWELDLSGKLRAATRSAQEEQNAAFWDLHAAKLHLATKVAGAHFRTGRLAQERALMEKSSDSHHMTLTVLRAREGAGLLTNTVVQQAQARQGTLDRALLDLERLHALAALQLATLKGQTQPALVINSPLPPPPSALPGTSTTALLRNRPDLLASEARVRAAFQSEEAARLNLLPSFQLNASAMGATNSLTNRFRVWETQVGPSLDIPVYDPARLAAVKSRRAETKAAAADYRATVLTAFEETESAFLNFLNRQQQHSSARAEVQALTTAHKNIIDSHRAGILSDLELHESEREVFSSQRIQVALQQAVLADHLALIRALGGGSEGK